MGFVRPTDSGGWKAFWREPSGAQRSKTFRTKKEATQFLSQVQVSMSSGAYVSPHASRTLFGDHARLWMKSWNTERSTAARDSSIMRNHVLAQWEMWQLGKIDHLSVQTWVSSLSDKRSRATVAECKRLMSGVMRSAVKNRLIGIDPTLGVRVPGRRVRDTDERIVTREDVRRRLVPVMQPTRYRTLVATAAFTGLRWGEAVGLCRDAVDLDGRMARVIRAVTEVAGRTEFKAFPKSRAGRRTVPLPDWLVDDLRKYMELYPPDGPQGLIFTNAVGGALRRTLFRSRVWRPALVRAGLLGQVREVDGKFEAVWSNELGCTMVENFGRESEAVQHVARNQHGGLRFHDLRHSYGTWLADDGIVPNKLAKVMGHEDIATTMQLYVRRTEDHDAIRDLLDG
jgi:integrase